MKETPYWTEHWNDIVTRMILLPRLLVACDFDGSLTPIVSHPNDARLTAEMRCILRKLSQCYGVALAIVSGRELADLRERIALTQIFYAGNHGLELGGPGIDWFSADAVNHRAELADAIALLREQTARFHGANIEDKRLTATVHWRLVDAAELPEFQSIVTSIVRRYPGLRVASGKSIWEIRPRLEWNKGSALLRLLSHLELTPADAIYIGDDATDEDAFRALPEALTLRVGTAVATSAQLRLHDCSDTAAFLFCLLGARMAADEMPTAATRAPGFVKISPDSISEK